jgi:hypothetical protein
MLPLTSDMTLLDRMVLGVERVRDRLKRASAALEAAGVPYAVVGGNAVAAWVATVDAAAVRNTQDVDILLRRADLDAAAAALEGAGFIRRHVAGMDVFLDGPEAKVRDAVHVVMAGEKVRPEYALTAPEVSESEKAGEFRVLCLEALVRMKLTSFRDKDRTHLRDMLEIGLIDQSWVDRLGGESGQGLKLLIDTPEQ